MWQEARLNLQNGAYGVEGDPNTMYFYWKHMEALGYPRASEAVAYFLQKVKDFEEAQAAQFELQKTMLMQGMTQQAQPSPAQSRILALAGRGNGQQ
jgi:hypothetical protein